MRDDEVLKRHRREAEQLIEEVATARKILESALVRAKEIAEMRVHRYDPDAVRHIREAVSRLGRALGAQAQVGATTRMAPSLDTIKGEAFSRGYERGRRDAMKRRGADAE